MNRKRDARMPHAFSIRENKATEEGPFDCSSVTKPTSQVLVDSTMQEFVNQWKQLDSRKVIADDKFVREGSDEEVNDQEQGRRKRAKKAEWMRSGWLVHRLKLPENFDYASRRRVPPSKNSHDNDSDKVISLLNPSLHVSYEQELWQLFHTVPTVQQVEEDAILGHALPKAFQVHVEIINGLRANGRLDGHALSRMRMNDRHGLPAGPQLFDQKHQNNMVPTIRFEVWRRQQQPKRGSSPSPHRMVLEFLGEQTLLDVHCAIAELAEDDLWEASYRNGTTKNSNNDSSESADESPHKQCSHASGLFFIEGIFYACGNVDYSEPMRRWIDEDGTRRVNGSRKTFLGILARNTELSSSASLSFRPMTEAKLESIPLRLGLRYYHAHHGDVESAVFVSDLRLGPKLDVPYPIIHDIWCPSTSMAECDACQHRPAVMVTPPSCNITDGGPRAICDRCCHHLKKSLVANESEELKVTRYGVWRDQSNLSLVASGDFFF